MYVQYASPTSQTEKKHYVAVKTVGGDDLIALTKL